HGRARRRSRDARHRGRVSRADGLSPGRGGGRDHRRRRRPVGGHPSNAGGRLPRPPAHTDPDQEEKGTTMRIVVIGGTGLIGSRVASKLSERGHEAVAASPDTGVDTITGTGLARALDGADVVVDVSNSPSLEGEAALEFFTTSTKNLLATEEAFGVRHHVALSIVGTDRLLAGGYFRAKMAQEDLIRES